MKKTKISVPLLMTLLFVATDNANAAYPPRITVWGLAGQQDQVRGDFLFPTFGNQNNLVYTDLQGSYTRANTSNHANYIGIGVGYRKLYNNAVYGAYLFFDRDRTQRYNNIFHVLSPGVEVFLPDWDFRINGYFPVSNRNKTISSFRPQPCDDCGNSCPNAAFVVFKGHQEFVNGFSLVEKAGTGFDTEVGYIFHRLYNAELHTGVYYFNFNHTRNFRHSNNTNHITGVEGRLEVPINPSWAVTVESSYDNYQHGTIMGGLRFDIFAPSPLTNSYDMQSRMAYPIPRNLGSLKKGSGIPTVKVTRNDGLFLTRDNIYFFTSQGGSVFVNPSQSGTFENPLRNDQFSQTVVNAIGNNANFYFNPGTYLIMGAGATPNSKINLLMGDSMFGRNPGYISSATGNARPIFLGRINLLEGNNNLASIQLFNRASGTGTTNLNLTALSIQNASNIFLCNDNINATVTVNGDLQEGVSNLATGINANNSQVTIETSNISGHAIVNGTIDTASFNFATGIGGNSTAATTPANFTGNTFTILNSTVNGTASAVAVISDNFAAGIGGNAASGGSAIFSGNTFKIANSNISGNVTANDNFDINVATGIGGFSDEGNAGFNNNTFKLINSSVNGTASVGEDNFNLNEAFGIGGGLSTFTFANNTFNLINSSVNGTASLGEDNFNINEAVGIGNVDSDFTNNTFNLTNSSVIGTASVGEDNDFNINEAVGIGGGSGSLFSNNAFNLTNSSVNGIASVGGDNFDINNAVGIGSGSGSLFSNNAFILNNSSVTGAASVGGDNSEINEASGIGAGFVSAFSNSTFNLNNSSVTGTASVGGNNFEFIRAVGIGENFTGIFTNNTFHINNSIINAIASVNGNNVGATNQAIGVNLANGGGNTITINRSIINTLAIVNGTNSGTNTGIGLVATGVGDIIIISNSTVNTTASATGPGTNTALGQIGNVFSTNTTFNTN